MNLLPPDTLMHVLTAKSEAATCTFEIKIVAFLMRGSGKAFVI